MEHIINEEYKTQISVAEALELIQVQAGLRLESHLIPLNQAYGHTLRPKFNE